MTGIEQNEHIAGSAEVNQSPNYHDGLVRTLAEYREVLETDFVTPGSVTDAVVGERISNLPGDEKLSIASLLSPRPGSNVERYKIVEGHDVPVTGANTPEALIIALSLKSLPNVKLPEAYDEPVMGLADRLQMRGGGPDVYSREDIKDKKLDFTPDIILKHGAANKAPYERLQSAIIVAEQTGYDGPIYCFTGRRLIKDDERQRVGSFYLPENEVESLVWDSDLEIAAAMKLGFHIDKPAGQMKDTRTYPDGTEVTSMIHPKSGQIIAVVTPTKEMLDATESGLHAALSTLQTVEGLMAKTDLANLSVAHVTSTHYGPMALYNSAEAQEKMGTKMGRQVVVGDNQPGRTPHAHLIEICMLGAKLLAK